MSGTAGGDGKRFSVSVLIAMYTAVSALARRVERRFLVRHLVRSHRRQASRYLGGAPIPVAAPARSRRGVVG
jgi:hypothetical protein